MASIEKIQLKRGNKADLELVLVNNLKPDAGEPIWEMDTNKIKIGNGVDNYVDLPYFNSSSSGDIYYRGYYFNNKFYEDTTYTAAKELPKDMQRVYIDIPTSMFYQYNGTSYQPCVMEASDINPGLVKLYKTHGVNEDGTMTQKAITEGVQAIKFAVERIDTNGNGELDDGDENCLVLDLPWD